LGKNPQPLARHYTVILHGRKDHVVPYALAAEMQEAIPNAMLVPFAGGHLFPLRQERKRLLKTLAEFLEKV
jgi:pimeloyl-ACP methyl ester carboxylesterase